MHLDKANDAAGWTDGISTVPRWDRRQSDLSTCANVSLWNIQESMYLDKMMLPALGWICGFLPKSKHCNSILRRWHHGAAHAEQSNASTSDKLPDPQCILTF
jgi:hypothetical protein